MLRKSTIINKLFWAGTAIVIFVLLVVLLCNVWVYSISKGDIYYNVEDLPVNNVGLVPGTSKFLKKGKVNPYFSNRIDAAAELYFAGKINYILVSGDNSTRHYNEPVRMRDALIEKNVPADKIILDYAGLRTLDSVIRAKEVFGLNHFTFISQTFQNRRASFIAHNNGIVISAFAAGDVKGIPGLRVKAREALARVLVVADVYLTHRQPRYLGEKIIIDELPEN